MQLLAVHKLLLFLVIVYNVSLRYLLILVAALMSCVLNSMLLAAIISVPADCRISTKSDFRVSWID